MTVVGTPGTHQYHAQINAIKSMASMVEVDEETFRAILRAREHPTLVQGQSGALWFKKSVYLTTYDGFVFLLRVPKPLDFTGDAPGALLVAAQNVNIPFL